MKPLRVGVVGVGHLGRIHARILSSMADCNLVGVADTIESNRREAAVTYRTQAYAGHRHLLGQIDAAVIATPTVHHHEVALDLLRHGVHLLVEKPLASNLAQADELVETARRHGALLQVGHVERFNPAFAAALPHLPQPKYIEAVRQSGFSFRSTDIGAVLDLMIHDIDLVLALVRSSVERVEALGVAIFGHHEDIVNARLVFKNGCVASLSASRASYTPQRTMQVWSRQCYAGLDLAARTATLVRASDAVLRRQIDVEHLLPEERERLKDSLLQEYLPAEKVAVPPCDPLSSELADFADSIRTGRSPKVSGEQGRDAIAVAEMVLASMEAHAWDGSAEGPIGFLPAAPPPAILRGPHWGLRPVHESPRKREAG